MITNSARNSVAEEVAEEVMNDAPSTVTSNISASSLPVTSNGKQHKVISARQTAEIIDKADETVLVLDCRSFIEYNTSHIKKAINVCCSKLMKRRLQQDKMSVRDLLLQSCRVDSDGVSTVVVYDQSTEQPAKLPADSFLVILMTKLLATFNNVFFLRGGFLHFQNHYSNLVESNSPVSPLLTSVTQPAQSHSPDTPPTRVLSFLYLGSQIDAMNKEFIESRRITYVLNVSAHCPQSPHVPEANFLRIPINDTYNEKIVPHLSEAFKFLDKVRETGGCVLVHCLAGISRSPTMAIAYLMHSLRLSYEEAYQYVRERRPTIAPNFNFLGQLLEYEKSMNENRHRRHKRQQSLSGTAATSGANDMHKPIVFVPSSLTGDNGTTANLVHQLQQQRIVQILRPHCSTLPKRPSLTGLAELAQAASATGAEDYNGTNNNNYGTSNWALTLFNDPSKISEKQPRLDSPTSAMARLSFDRSISVEVRLPINQQKNSEVTSMSIDIECNDCATPTSKNSSQSSSDPSSLAALLAKAAVASASAAANLSSLPLRACVVDARLSSALSSAHHRALTCAAAGCAGGLSMPSFDNLLVASLSASHSSAGSSAASDAATTAAETFAAWRKTRSLDNMTMLDPLIESPDRPSGWSPTTPTAAVPSGANGNTTTTTTNGGPSWVVRAASASLAEQPANNNSNNSKNNGGNGLLCGSGTVSPASSSLSIHSVCSSTTEIAA